MTVPLILAALLAAPASAADAPFRDLAFDEAKRAAAKEGKLLFVDFVSDHCGPCERMRRTTYKDEKVLARLATFVAVEPNADRVPKVARELRVSSYPTLLLFSSKGVELDRTYGYHDGPALLKFLDDAVAGKTVLARLNAEVAAATDEGERVDLRNKRARALAGAGRDEEALEEFLWLFDHGMRHRPEYAGVRGSFLLSEIVALGGRYPPAKKALEARRAAAWRELAAVASSTQAARDMAAIDRSSGRSDRTVKSYDSLPKDDPRRKTLGPETYSWLRMAGRYADALEAYGQPDLIAHFDRLYGLYWNGEAENAGFDAETIKDMRELALDEASTWAGMLAGAKRDDDARRMIERLKALDSSPEALAALRRGLHDASRDDLGDALGLPPAPPVPETKHFR